MASGSSTLTRIPAPGKVKQGLVVKEALSCVDFLPTLMTMLESPLNGHAVDGRDASVLFAGKNDSWNDIAFLRSTPNQPWLCAVTAKYKLVYSANERPWLIDVEADPNELTNLIDQPEHRDRIARMTRALLAYSRAHQDPHARVPKIQAAIQQNLP